MNQFKNIWLTELQNIERNPILRNYNTFKLEFGMEKYLDMVTDTHRTGRDNQTLNQLAHTGN